MDIVDQFISYLSENTLTPEQLENVQRAIQRSLPLEVPRLQEHVAPIAQGYLYAYRIPFIQATVSFDGGVPSESWCLVKVGRSDPGNCYNRLGGEFALLHGKRQCLDPKPRLRIPQKSGPLTDTLFEESIYCNWTTYKDLLFVLACNIGRENEYRCWPSGLGIDVGTGVLVTPPERMHIGCYFATLRIKTTALRAWILGRSLDEAGYDGAPSESLGESEWVVIPKEVFKHARQQQPRTELALQELIAHAKPLTGSKKISSISLTLPQREEHQTLCFDSAMHDWPK